MSQPAYHDLLIKGFGGSFTRERFSAVHRDLLTEIFNKQTEAGSGTFQSTFSSNIDTVSTWVIQYIYTVNVVSYYINSSD